MSTFGKSILVTCLLSLTLFFSTNVFAEGFYANAFVGRSDADLQGFDKGTSVSIGGGYLFTPYFGVEASYINFGDMKDDIAPVWTLSSDALVLAAVGKYPVTPQFALYGKLGLFAWDAELKEAGYGEIASDDGTDVTWALGGMVNITQQVSVLAQYQRYTFDIGGEDLDLDNLSLGLQIHF